MRRLALFLLLLSSPAASAPKIAVVVDDFGLTYKKNVPDEKWYELKFPITYAVMPASPRSVESGKKTKAAGHELIIHFPFDPYLSLKLPKDSVDPKDLEQVEKLLDQAFKQIPDAVGLNNHRSYKGTMNRPMMTAFMERLKKRGVYFLDSHVSPKSVAFEEARKAGIPATKNWIFMEEPKHYSKEFAAQMLRRCAARAKKLGSCVIIGHHYFHGTYEALVDEVPKLQAEGFEFVFASALLEQ
ncbi:MAG: divergent polysaccharide deacetylase family protein [Elusimicrobia bacterium]|nr:divergent polysaccharide deacetylase family protein [Elusimicrobiota bacterium]